MRICIDLDNTIAQLKGVNQTYYHVKPKLGVIEKLIQWHEQGHYIIIHTARHMVTCDGNIQLTIDKIGEITKAWLSFWKIPYDELIFGKPYADVYIDDKALKFEDNWDIIQLPIHG